VKIADFGLAKANRNTVTRGVGTPSYMPPEMFDDETEGLNVSMLAVDIYALGIILGQLWTKRSPWKGKSPHKVTVAKKKKKIG
jgi:serine/threonine protein kinase